MLFFSPSTSTVWQNELLVHLWYRESWWFSIYKSALCVQWWQGMVSSLWPSAGGPDVTRATLLTESLMGLSPLMGERKWENARKWGLSAHCLPDGVWLCILFSISSTTKKKKVRLHTDLGSEKIRHRLIVLYHDVASVWFAIHNWFPSKPS